MRPAPLAAGLLVLLLAPLRLPADGLGIAVDAFSFVPAACVGAPYADVPANHPLCAWIDQAKDDHLSLGCGGGNYCPDAPVTRAQAAVLLARAARGTATWSPFDGVFQQVKIVSPVPGDAPASGLRLLAALAQLDDGTQNRRYLLWLEPGDYDLGNAQLDMQPHVVIQGAGRDLVEITTSNDNFGAVGATQAQMRSLSFRNSGNTPGVHGIDLSSSGTLRDVLVSASGGAASTAVIGVRTGHSLEDVQVNASGGDQTVGIDVTAGFVTLTRVRASATGAEQAYGIKVSSTAGDVVIQHSTASSRLSELRSWAIYVANVAASGSVLLRDVRAHGGGSAGDSPLIAGLYALAGPVVVEDSRLEADDSPNAGWGLACQSGPEGVRVEVHNSRIVGPDATVHVTDADCNVLIGGSQLKGAAVDDGGLGTVTCVALYGDGFSSPGINSCF